MAIKHILVPLTGCREAYHVPLGALRLAEALKAHVTATSVATPFNVYFMPEAGVASAAYAGMMTSVGQLETERHARARTYFDNAVALTKTPIVDTPVCMRASTAWADSTALARPTISSIGALADLVVADLPGGDGFSELNAIEEALFAVRKPVLVLPPGTQTVGRSRVAVAWNGSAEAVAAVSRALDLLEPGAEITIVQVGALRPARTSADDLADYLGWHCFAAKVRRVDDEPRATAKILLKEAEAVNAEMIVCGAYTHSRIRDFLLGGVTGELLRHSTLPLLMAH